jgi:predicted GNAT superfamily acetyltransferase
MEQAFASGRAIDAVLVLVALQAALLVAWARRTGRGVPPASLLATLAAGGFLLLALRSALVGAWWGWTGLALLAALAAHLIDLRLRWR